VFVGNDFLALFGPISTAGAKIGPFFLSEFFADKIFISVAGGYASGPYLFQSVFY
jgi:hypothetical protein